MAYATYDFTESLDRVAIEPSEIDAVLRAWGHGNEGGGYAWSDDGGGTEWSGGFLMSLKDGVYVYLTGWCDYTGWGCQDGVELHRFINEPSYEELKAVDSGVPPEVEWDIQPADLNRWLAARLSAQERP